MMRSLLCFLDEAMEDYNAVAHDSTEKRPSDPFGSVGTQFEEACAKRTRVRHCKSGAILFHLLGESNETRVDTRWPPTNVCFDTLIQEFDNVRLAQIIAHRLYLWQVLQAWVIMVFSAKGLEKVLVK